MWVSTISLAGLFGVFVGACLGQVGECGCVLGDCLIVCG